MKAGVGALLAVVLYLASVDVDAHHSFAAQYDADKPVTLVGTVTKVEWTNPHARFYVDVKDDKGVVTNWNLELAKFWHVVPKEMLQRLPMPLEDVTAEAAAGDD